MKNLSKITTVAAAAAILAGCAGLQTTALVGAKVRDGGFYGPTGPTFTLRVAKPVTERFTCEYEHVSHLLVGPPFGPKHEEDSLDQVSCGVSFGL